MNVEDLLTAPVMSSLMRREPVSDVFEAMSRLRAVADALSVYWHEGPGEPAVATGFMGEELVPAITVTADAGRVRVGVLVVPLDGERAVVATVGGWPSRRTVDLRDAGAAAHEVVSAAYLAGASMGVPAADAVGTSLAGLPHIWARCGAGRVWTLRDDVSGRRVHVDGSGGMPSREIRGVRVLVVPPRPVDPDALAALCADVHTYLATGELAE